MTSTADWGLYYSDLNWRSFPVSPGRKTPVYRGWQADATTEPELILQWQIEDRNLGLVAGEAFDAWDIEGVHLGAFSEWLWRTGHCDRAGHLDLAAPIAATGRGGVHILTAPTGVDGSRNLYLGATHIGELKSRGGFIVACPSEVDYDGAAGTYIWTTAPAKGPLPDAPAWLLTLLERPAAVRKTLPTRLASPNDVVAVLGRLAGSVAYSTAESHHRNSYLYWATRQAIEDGVPVHHVVKAMTAAAIQAGLDRDDQGMAGIEKTIESAIGAESVAA